MLEMHMKCRRMWIKLFFVCFSIRNRSLLEAQKYPIITICSPGLLFLSKNRRLRKKDVEGKKIRDKKIVTRKIHRFFCHSIFHSLIFSHTHTPLRCHIAEKESYTPNFVCLLHRRCTRLKNDWFLFSRYSSLLFFLLSFLSPLVCFHWAPTHVSLRFFLLLLVLCRFSFFQNNVNIFIMSPVLAAKLSARNIRVLIRHVSIWHFNRKRYYNVKHLRSGNWNLVYLLFLSDNKKIRFFTRHFHPFVVLGDNWQRKYIVRFTCFNFNFISVEDMQRWRNFGLK